LSLLESSTATYLAVNGSAVGLWRLLVAGTDRSALVDEFVSSFELEREAAAADVDRFLAQLDERDLLEADRSARPSHAACCFVDARFAAPRPGAFAEASCTASSSLRPRLCPTRRSVGCTRCCGELTPRAWSAPCSLQRWYASHGAIRDVVIGVSAPTDDFEAHAWLDGDPDGEGSFRELSRIRLDEPA
jgi:Coenzyme PQQ synthesis protein D (PqqD)